MIGYGFFFMVTGASHVKARGYYKPPIGEFKGVFHAKDKLRQETITLDHLRPDLYNSDGPGDPRELR
jgi:hypothetical protein